MRGEMIFKMDFWKSEKWDVSADQNRHDRSSRLCDAEGCLRGDVPPSEVGAFLKN